MSIRVTVTRPELTAEERQRRQQEVEKAAAALIRAMRQGEKEEQEWQN